ncbi:fibronectin type III domain-containing protein [Parabacteroides pacaensis]|uniref:fibronectin type III domain-containing protein n=1 Tax=Parabacteroides pacaensis TaxID=2086575 RepID=UPI00131BBE51|nr:fibronectin type III domain-containing protein [Parabacteroides pacaensis]
MKQIGLYRKYSSVPFFMLLFILCFCFSVASATKNVLNWKDGGVRIELKEYLDIPEMKWPETLLRYQLDLRGAGISNAQSLLLLDKEGRAVPFQLTDLVEESGMIRYATLCFLSDLPSGAAKTFQLIPASTKSKHPILLLPNPVRVTCSSSGYLIENGLVRLQISKDLADENNRIVLKLGTATEWLGELLLPENTRLTDFQMEDKMEGEVFSEYHLRLCFGQSRIYRLMLRLIAGMDYIEMDESMEGFSPGEALSMELNWNNFHPEVRYCPTRTAQIDKKGHGYDNFRWEPIDGLQVTMPADKHPLTDFDQLNTKEGKLPFRLSSYHNWMTWWRLHTAAFWNEQTNQSVGIYINDFEKWKDPAYPLWGSKEYLSVEYYYKHNRFFWKFPLVNGERSVAIALYPHVKDKAIVDETNKSLVYIDYLRRWYGWISLDKTKNWILDYKSDRSVHQPFYCCEGQEMKPDAKGILEKLKRNVQAMATAGERISGPTPVGAREYLDYLTPLFEISEKQLSLSDYKKARTYYLFMNYVFMDEALMPIRTLLSGHPNFLADLKSISGAVAFLFPDHPEAQVFADHFEKSIALNLNYHIRPEVKSWGAKGGRSTENLSCYTWAFLRPTLKTAFLLHHYYDGKNRLLQPNISIYCHWLLNTLTAPLDILDHRRAVPPQGAHARKPDIPNLLNALGQELRFYDPLLAEHIFWETHPEDDSFESRKSADAWAIASKKERPYERGTNPRLQSEKYTGYGFILRRNYGAENEMYVNLQQIDDGPNYRWGRAGKGGNGVIYYYANGKRYSHNGIEDVGDGPFGDTERCTNFGVKKQGIYRGIGEYRSVGRNDLTEPLFDFGFAQFATVNANDEVSSHYKSRSVLMAENDYILVFDDVATPEVEGRFSWFVGVEDEFPVIYQLEPGIRGSEADLHLTSSLYHKDNELPETKGKYFDGQGDFLTLITHKPDLNVKYESGICRVKFPQVQTDWLFRNDQPIVYKKGGIGFNGTSGMIRKKSKNRYQAALFNGSMVAIPGLIVTIENGEGKEGISLEAIDGRYTGKIQVSKNTTIRFTMDRKLTSTFCFYLNGLPVNPEKTDGKTYLLKVAPGLYNWQLTDRGVIPGQPHIEKSISGKDWCELSWKGVPGARSYQIWKSENYGTDWQLCKKNIIATNYRLDHLGTDKKIHLRVVAEAAGGTGLPSGDYPVYLSASLPHAPEGLRVETDKSMAVISWGQILGADNYTLYRRKQGAGSFERVYQGKERTTRIQLEEQIIYEFAVTATNGNGESEKSILVDTDPARFINWNPVPREKFRRDPENQENGYVEYNPWLEDAMELLIYPE